MEKMRRIETKNEAKKKEKIKSLANGGKLCLEKRHKKTLFRCKDIFLKQTIEKHRTFFYL